MTQGAHNTLEPNPARDLHLNDWLDTRMLRYRRINIGDQWFAFTGALPAEQLATAFPTSAATDGEDQAEDADGGHGTVASFDLHHTLKALLVDAGDADDLDAALARQARPVNMHRQQEFIDAIAAHITAGVDVGESSAS